MKFLNNTCHGIVLVAVSIALTSLSFTLPVDTMFVCDNGGEPWTMLHKKDGILVHYDIQDCMKGHLSLCLKIGNNTGQPKKLRFTVDIVHPDKTKETFTYIKTIAPYSSEKSDCSEASRQTGLVRPLKNGSEQSLVTIHFQKENALAAN